MKSAFVAALLRDFPQPRCKVFEWNTGGRQAIGTVEGICRREKSNNSSEKSFGLDYYGF